MKILVLNAGWSSQKSCLYEFKAEKLPIPSRPLWEADIDWSRRAGTAELKVTTAQGHTRAQLAFDIYVHRLRSHIGAMLASLGGLDALAFTAGVGEHSAAVRAAACEVFAFLGLKVDSEKNAQSQADRDIATPDSTVRILVIHTQEDWAIARECWKLTQGQDNAKFVTAAHFVSRPSGLRES